MGANLRFALIELHHGIEHRSNYGSYAQSNSYLFVWARDGAKKSTDFLTVLDAEPFNVFLCLCGCRSSRPPDGRGTHQSKPIARYLPSPCL